MKNGTNTVSDPGLPENDLKNIEPAIKATKKSIPPINSHLQATMRIPIKIQTGILCIRNPRSFLPNGSFPLKTSIENIIIKRIARIVKILGIQ